MKRSLLVLLAGATFCGVARADGDPASGARAAVEGLEP